MFLRAPLLLFLFCLTGLVSACGLAPAIDGETATRLAQVRVLPIAERQGQALNTALREVLNPRGLKIGPAYDLDLTVVTTITDSFSDASGSAGGNYRARGTMRAAGTLRDFQGQTLWQGTATRTSLLALGAQPSLSAIAEAKLIEDLANLVAQDIKLQLARVL